MVKENRKTEVFRFCSVSKNLVEFRPAGRNKMEIHFIRRLCRPEKYISPRKCGICAPKAHKLCAQSRRSPFCQESVSFFDRLKRRLTLSTGAFVVQRLFFNGNSQKCIIAGAASRPRAVRFRRRFSPFGSVICRADCGHRSLRISRAFAKIIEAGAHSNLQMLIGERDGKEGFVFPDELR